MREETSDREPGFAVCRGSQRVRVCDPAPGTRVRTGSGRAAGPTAGDSPPIVAGFAQFDGRCSLRTWVYRVAHNVAIRHVSRQQRLRERLAGIESIEVMAAPDRVDLAASQSERLARLSSLIQRLRPLDRQIIVLYLEDLDANSIAEVTGLSAANVAMKIHRIKKVLKRWFGEGGSHGE